MALEGTWVWPLPSLDGRPPVISDGYYSARPGLPLHGGVDLMYRRVASDPQKAGTPNGTPNYVMPEGTPALAASSGVVYSAGVIPTGGAVVIDHGPRKAATFYAHLSRVDVKKGDRVEAGDPIGIIGGSPLDGEHLKHLHFELWLGGPDDKVDPAPIMVAWPVVKPPASGLLKLALAAFVAWGGWKLWRSR